MSLNGKLYSGQLEILILFFRPQNVVIGVTLYY